MVSDFFDRAFAWWTGRDEPPPRRRGCVDLKIFSTPRTEGEATFLKNVERLKKAQKDGRALTTELIGYFGRRYQRKDIREYVGCPFDVYLKRPLVVEDIRDDLASSTSTS